MFDKLQQLGWCDKYIQYVLLKQKGLIRQAKQSLVDFIKIYQEQPKVDRRKFIDYVNSEALHTKDYDLLPYNLYNEVLLPDTLLWIKEEPLNFIPYKWSSKLELVKTALQLAPSDQETLILYGNRLIQKIAMNQHEVSRGYQYDGNAKDDYEAIDFYQPYLENIQDAANRESLAIQLADLKACALDNIN
jgi:hypothetical protein